MKYNPNQTFNRTLLTAVPLLKYGEICELIQLTLKQKVRVYLCDPLQPGSCFEIKKIDVAKQVLLVQQPQSVAKSYGIRSYKLGMSFDELVKNFVAIPIVITEFGDVLNVKPVTIETEKEVIKKEIVYVEKNSSDSISRRKFLKEVAKIEHSCLKDINPFIKEKFVELFEEIKKIV